jgi:uncharacterized protein YlxW (UPF0749 family)
MLITIVSLVSRYWKPVLLIAGFCGALLYRSVLVRELNSARKEAADASERIASLTASNTAFQAAVQQCNTQTGLLRNAGLAAQRSADARAAAAARRADNLDKAARTAAAALEKAQIAPQCEGAIQWANQQGPELGRW